MDTVYSNIKRYAANNITPYPIIIRRGKGVYVYDQNNKQYLDMISAISVVNFGYHHPRLKSALITQMDKICITPRLFHTSALSSLVVKACQLTHMDKALPMNSGVEAVEAAIKTARKWAYTKKNIPSGQAEIIVCDNSFHGRTVTAVSMSSINSYKDYFGPLTPGFRSIPFNDAATLERTINKNTCAFIVEPIQGEAGVVIPSDSYLQQCATICKKNNVLFIVDEIQTGMGRTGAPLASMHHSVDYDGILLGKALGGGILPISLFLAKDHLMDVLVPGDHGSTFGGNPLACAVATEAIETLIQEDLSNNAADIGRYFLTELKKINSDAIIEIRGKGLIVGIQLDPSMVTANAMFETLCSLGLVCMVTRNNVLRLLPPLIITRQQIDTALDIIMQSFAELKLLRRQHEHQEEQQQ